MRAGAVVFGDKAITDLTSKHLFLRTADDINFTALAVASAQHDVDVHLVTFQGDFRCDGVLEGLRKTFGGVKHTPIIHVGDGHGNLFALGFTIWSFDRNTTLPSDPPNCHFRKSLEESIVETIRVLSADGVGQYRCRRIRCTLALQTAHVGSKRGKYVTCR